MRIDKLVLRSGEEVRMGSFVVLVGANATGKSTLLAELYTASTNPGGAKPSWKWVQGVDIAVSDPQTLAREVLASLIPVERDQPTPEGKKYRSRALPGQAPLGRSQYLLLEAIAEGASDETPLTTRPEFLVLLAAFDNCDERAQVNDTAELVDRRQAPTDPINVLKLDRTRFRSIQSRIRSQFAVELVLLDHRGRILELGVAHESLPRDILDEPDELQRYDKTEEWKQKHFTLLSSAGHGIRAMSHMLLSLLEPLHKVLLIDEPELFLYPAQKRDLGHYLARLASNEGKQVVVATHDATFLQGVLESDVDVQVLRLSGSLASPTRSLQHCDLGPLSALGAPARQTEYLNALFFEHAILLEGATDRILYQSARDLLGIETDMDVGFVAGAGASSTLNPGDLCQRVGIPYAYVFDFDVLLPAQISIVKRACALRGSGWDGTGLEQFLATAAKEVLEKLESENVGAETAKKELTEKALERLKARGIKTDGLTAATRDELRAEIAQLQQLGIYVVENGELESWFPDIRGARYCELAVERIREEPDSATSLRDFLRRILRGLRHSG